MNEKITYRPEIDGLRAIAVLSVIIFHLNALILPGGYMGVDVFFVISGYLITTVTKKDLQAGQFTIIGFYIRRIKRIIPALYVLLLIVTIAAIIFLLPTDLKDYGRSLLSQSVFGSNIYFYFKSDYFDTPSLLKPILHTWSLSAEEQFYIIYPLLFLALSKFLKAYIKYAMIGLAIIGLAVWHYTYVGDQSAAFYLLPSKSWELLLGALFTFNFLTIDNYNKALRQTVSLIGLLLIFYAVFFFTKNTQLYGLNMLVPAVGAALVILGGGETIAGKFLSMSLFKFTGKISYSLYLWHWPLLVFYLYAIDNAITLSVGLLLFSISYVLATLSYKYVETPLRAIQAQKHLYFWGVLAGIILFGGTGYYLNKHNGLPNRFSAGIQQLLIEAQPKSECVSRLVYNKKNGMHYVGRCDTDTNIKPAILLWGDSHSGMIEPVLNSLSNKYHEKFAFYNCPSALNVYIANWDQSYLKSPCYSSNQEIIDFIKNNHIKCVLFASAWSQYTEGRELKMEGAGQKDKLYADSLTKDFSTTDSKRVFKSKITYTVNLLSNLNVDVWIMKQVPQHQFWAPNEVAKRLIYKQDTTTIGRGLTDHQHRQSFVNSVFDALANKNNVHVLDPTKYFLIRGNFLSVYKNGKCLYFDYNHLSPYGASLLEPMFEPMFQSLKAVSK